MISICLDHDIFALCFMSLDVFQCLLAHSLETNRICILQLCKNCINVNYFETSPISKLVKNLPAMQETRVQPLGWEDPLGKEMATHSSILAWKISWTLKLGGLQSMRSQVADRTY